MLQWLPFEAAAELVCGQFHCRTDRRSHCVKAAVVLFVLRRAHVIDRTSPLIY
jgi:hypothetical protein